MKVLRSPLLLLAIFCIVLNIQSCKDESFCEEVSCENGGIATVTANGCACDCSGTLYTGSNCENFNPTQIQALLDEGITPLELFNGNIPLDSLYGRHYENGLIFYLNTTNGTGLVAAIEDQSINAEWGCNNEDIISLNNFYTEDPTITEGGRIGDGATNTDAILNECNENGIAAKLCRAIEMDWFLPSSSELRLMYTNLHENGHGGFANSLYWSSSEVFPGLAWYQDFATGYTGGDYKNRGNYVRAARAF